MQKKEKQKKATAVDFGVVYRFLDLTYHVEPVYKPELQPFIWGVEVAGVKISLYERKDTHNWVEGQTILTGEISPSVDELKIVAQNRVLFNQALQTLGKLSGKDVHLLVEEDYYWAADTFWYDDETVEIYAVYMETGESVLMKLNARARWRATLLPMPNLPTEVPKTPTIYGIRKKYRYLDEDED